MALAAADLRLVSGPGAERELRALRDTLLR
jgi:hypothetical protein